MNQDTQQKLNNSVAVTIKKESAPGNTSKEDSIEHKIKHYRNWTVTPAIDVKRSKFTYVHEIMIYFLEKKKNS